MQDRNRIEDLYVCLDLGVAEPVSDSAVARHSGIHPSQQWPFCHVNLRSPGLRAALL